MQHPVMCRKRGGPAPFEDYCTKNPTICRRDYDAMVDYCAKHPQICKRDVEEEA